MIICAAIKIKLKNTDKEVIVHGHRHINAIETLTDLGLKKDKDYTVIEEGFITHDDVFLTRHESWLHALSCGQICASLLEQLPLCPGTLFSEDIY